jgi:RimJ/RimL family protein N-acetyltransferase
VRTVTPIRLRPATVADCLLLWQWRNDPDTRAASSTPGEVSLAEHLAWLEATLAGCNRRLFIVETDGISVATARLDLGAEDAVVSITVAPERRGGGLAAAVLLALCEEAVRLLVRRLVAHVMPGNVASLRAFARAGFTPAAGEPGQEHVVTLVRDLTRSPSA